VYLCRKLCEAGIGIVVGSYDRYFSVELRKRKPLNQHIFICLVLIDGHLIHEQIPDALASGFLARNIGIPRRVRVSIHIPAPRQYCNVIDVLCVYINGGRRQLPEAKRLAVVGAGEMVRT
jgi:hypothetical protein